MIPFYTWLLKVIPVKDLLIIVATVIVVYGIIHLSKPKPPEPYVKVVRVQKKVMTKSGRSAVESEQLEMTKQQLKKALKDGQLSDVSYNKTIAALKKTIEDLNIKTSRVKEAQASETETNVVLKTKVVYKDSAKTFNWADNYVSVSGLFKKDSVTCKVVSKDTLIQVVERVPKKFLFFKFGTKALKQTITSRNPHTRIVYSSQLKVK